MVNVQVVGNFVGFDAMAVYSATKAYAALYFAEWARQNSDYKLFVVSPGATTSTTGASSSEKTAFESEALSMHFRLLMPILMPVMRFFGQMHSLDDGSTRYIDAVTGKYDDKYPTGTFVASAKGATGSVVDQTTLSEGKIFADVDKQKAAFEALSIYTSSK